MRSDRVLAVRVACGLGFGDRIRARAEVPKQVRSIGTRQLRDRHLRAFIVGPGEGDRRVGDRGFAGVLRAVVVGIDVDESREARKRQLAEVVRGRRDAAAERDRGDRITRDRTALRSRIVHVRDHTGGLNRLNDLIRARRKVREVVRAVRRGRGRRDRRLAIAAQERDENPADPRIARAERAAVVGVEIHLAVQASQRLAEQVVRGVRAGSQRERADRISDDRAARSSGCVRALAVSRRLGFGQRVRSGTKRRHARAEAERAVRRRRGGE